MRIDQTLANECVILRFQLFADVFSRDLLPHAINSHILHFRPTKPSQLSKSDPKLDLPATNLASHFTICVISDNDRIDSFRFVQIRSEIVRSVARKDSGYGHDGCGDTIC